MIERDRKARVLKIRELVGCGLLDAKKYELYLWEFQKEINIENIRELQYRYPRHALVTERRKKTCYQCESQVYELSPRSRCVTCEFKRANVNEECFEISQRYIGCEMEELDKLQKELNEVMGMNNDSTL